MMQGFLAGDTYFKSDMFDRLPKVRPLAANKFVGHMPQFLAVVFFLARPAVTLG